VIDAFALKQEIAVLLNGLVGRYKDEGWEEDAIAVLPDPDYGYDFPNNGTVTEGMEVVILRPYPKVSSLFGGRQMQYRWQIVLKQWDSQSSLLDAVEALVGGLESHMLTSPVLVPPDPGRGIIEQVRFEIFEWEFQALVV
jgi:hypothetical protein